MSSLFSSVLYNYRGDRVGSSGELEAIPQFFLRDVMHCRHHVHRNSHNTSGALLQELEQASPTGELL